MVFDPYGKHPSKQLENIVMDSLSKTVEFAEAMAHPVGRELFKSLITLMEEKFILIYNNKDTEEDRAIFKACKTIGGEWKKILESHSANVNTIVKLEEEKSTEKFK